MAMPSRSTAEPEQLYCEKCEEPGVYLSMVGFVDYMERHYLCPSCEHYRKTVKALK